MSDFYFNLFHVVIDSSDSSADLFTSKEIETLLESRRSITDWAYIFHDRDVYTSEDEKENPLHIAGTPKPPHYHLVILVRNNNWQYSSKIAEWLSLPLDKFRKPNKGGLSGFNTFLIYFTHTSDECRLLKKTIYPIENIISKNPEDIRVRLNAILDKKKIRKLTKRIIEQAKSLLETNRYTIDDILEFFDFKDSLDRHRLKAELASYLKVCKISDNYSNEIILKKRGIPEFRINIYVCGDSGIGKTALCKLVAGYIFPMLELNECYFPASNKSSTLKNYIGQPVVIWDEGRGDDILRNIDGQSNFLKVFNPIPDKESIDVKFGSVILYNKYNIVNSLLDFDSFIGRLSVDDNPKQYYRRFLIYLELKNNYLSTYLNDAVITNDMKDIDKYTKVSEFRFNIKEISAISNKDTRRQFIRKLFNSNGLSKVIDKVKKYTLSVPDKPVDLEKLCELYGLTNLEDTEEIEGIDIS